MECVLSATDSRCRRNRAVFATHPRPCRIEAELQELDEESAAELLESIGQTERGLDALARAGFTR